MKEGEEIMNTITFIGEVKQNFGKVYHEEFTGGSTPDILLVSVKISSAI
jgi:hypothetical protein